MTDTAAETAAGAETKPPAVRGWKVWRRPALPEPHKGNGLGWGNALIVLGFAALVLVPVMVSGDYGAGGSMAALIMVAPLGGSVIALGIVISSVCLILREIRQAAYEAALRAGEVETRTSSGPAAPFQKWQGN